MSEAAAEKKQSAAEKKSNPKAKSDEAEADPFLADGFSVIDAIGVKEEEEDEQSDNKKKPQEGAKTEGEAAPAKVDGNADVTTGSSELVQTKNEILSGGGDRKAEVAVKKEDVKKESDSTSAAEKATPKPTPAATKAKTNDATNGADSEKKAAPKDDHSTEPKDDSLLITAEEDIDVAENKEGTENNSEKEKDNKEKDKTVANGDTGKGKMKAAPCMWVSNIARRVKATDLKRVFSKHGRVITAKIVTNGKSYFGYVCMDSRKSIERCIKHLNNTKLGDKKITISIERPDAPKKAKAADSKNSSVVIKKEDEKSGDSKDKSKKDDGKKTDDEKDSSKKKDDKRKHSQEKEKLPVKKRLEMPKRDETIPLKREIRALRIENDNLRRRLKDAHTRGRADVFKARKFEGMLKDAEDKLREERKKWERERESLIKKNRMEMSRLDAERDILEKDRMDLKRRREDLEHEMRKFAEMQRAAERSSHRGSRKSRSISPRVSSSSKRMRTAEIKHDSASKKARWTGDRIRTPPPPPKLTAPSEQRSRKPDSDRFYEDRPFRREVPVYVPPGEYPPSRESSRHSRGGLPPPETKSTVVVPARSSMWGSSNSIPSSEWRGGSGDVPSQYPEGRYREQPYRSSTGGYPGEPRDEIRVYSRQSDPEYRRPPHYEPSARKY